MKRFALVPLLVLATVAPSLATEDGDRHFTGRITAANPASKYYGGATEILYACGESIDQEVPADTFNGIDGVVIPLEESMWGRNARLLAEPISVPLWGNVGDVDAWFYDESCGLIKPSADNPSAYHMATSSGVEYGTIPQDAAYVAIDLASGANTVFTLSIFAPAAG